MSYHIATQEEISIANEDVNGISKLFWYFTPCSSSIDDFALCGFPCCGRTAVFKDKIGWRCYYCRNCAICEIARLEEFRGTENWAPKPYEETT